MDIFLTVIVLVVVAVAIFSGPMKTPPKSQINETPTEQTPKLSTPSGQPATPTPKQVFPSPATPIGIDINNLSYPHATVISQNGTHLSLQSSDNADAITDWYKQKIISAGANSKSFVKTSANDNVNNSLVGATSKFKISVKITKPSDSSTVSVDVTISSS